MLELLSIGEPFLTIAVVLIFLAVYVQDRRERLTRERVLAAMARARGATIRDVRGSAYDSAETRSMILMGMETHHIQCMAELGFGVPHPEQVEARLTEATQDTGARVVVRRAEPAKRREA